MSRPFAAVELQRSDDTRIEVRMRRSMEFDAATVVLLDQRELLEWVLGVVGPQALREFALTHLPDEQLTTQQAADLLGMSRPTLIKLVDRGELPHTLVGNRRYIPLPAIEAYRLRTTIRPDVGASRAPDHVIDANLRRLQQMAEEEGDFS